MDFLSDNIFMAVHCIKKIIKEDMGQLPWTTKRPNLHDIFPPQWKPGRRTDTRQNPNSPFTYMGEKHKHEGERDTQGALNERETKETNKEEAETPGKWTSRFNPLAYNKIISDLLSLNEMWVPLWAGQLGWNFVSLVSRKVPGAVKIVKWLKKTVCANLFLNLLF